MGGGSVIIMYQGLTGTNSMKVRIVYLELRCKSKFTCGVSVRASVLDKEIGMKFTQFWDSMSNEQLYNYSKLVFFTSTY